MRCAVCLLLPVLLLSSAPALADEPAKAEAKEDAGIVKRLNDAFASIDAAFGDYFVTPLAKVLFYDLAFWDNTLEGEAAIGHKVGEEEIVGWDEDRGYHLKRRVKVPAEKARVVLEAPVTVTMGKVEVEIRPGPKGAVAHVKPQAVSLEGVETVPLAVLEDVPPALKEAASTGERRIVRVPAGALAPFAIFVEETPDGARVIEENDAFALSQEELAKHLKPDVGDTVALDDGRGTVEAVEENALVVAMPLRYAADLEVENPKGLRLPFIVVWLILGACFFTVRMGFINLRGFRHAVEVTAGKYDRPGDAGEISHFQALASALSATVGLGNIAGVAVAVGVGGPGAVFWMVVAGLLGMSSKFTECTLGQMYRDIDEQGVVSGGPMRYLAKGLNELGLGQFGKVLAVLFAVMCIGGSFGGGNMFQANQAFAAVAGASKDFLGVDISSYSWVFGLLLAGLVGLVIIGGIKRIGAAASYIVPAMCGLYLLAGFWILLVHWADIPSAFGKILREAFTPEAGYGGLLGVLITGFQRAAFSNEAGIGSASIAHSAAATDEPVREGIVALLEPFIDTIIVCTMTGLVVVITGAYKTHAGDGVLMTSAAFGSVIGWFPMVLSVAVLLFAFSTMISWSYYGERCFTALFGKNTSLLYRIIFLFFVFFGAVFQLGNVLGFSDLMVLGMAFPNIFGAVLLSRKVRERLDDYWTRYRSGAMKPSR